MQSSNAPTKLKLPFASSGGKNSIPNTSQIGIVAGAASYPDGFPPLTRTPLVAGGVPPSGLDMNGVLFEMTAIARWLASGAGFAYDSAWASDSNVGGYPKGARVMRSDGVGYWLNTTDNNTTDPEAGGAGWVPDYTYGVAAVTMTSSNVTLTALQYGKPIIVITGTLTANLNLIFPNLAGQWTVINSTTGSFTITAKTAAGTGVVVSGSQAVVGDGTNIYSTSGAAVVSSSDNGIQDFRITLTSGAPVTTADVTAATTVYVTPYKGNRISLYDGASAWNLRSSAELSIAVPATTNQMYDLFAYDNGGVVALELLAWTNDTTRATALTYQNGVLVKSSATTRRYLGSFRTGSVSGQVIDSYTNRLVWNYNNRVLRQGRNTYSADRATTSATYVELNSEIRIGFVVGVSEDALNATTVGSVQGDANRWAGTAWAFDGTTAEAGLEGGAIAGGAIGSGVRGNVTAGGFKLGIAPGYHYATILGKTDSGTCTWQSATGTLGAKFYAHLGIMG